MVTWFHHPRCTLPTQALLFLLEIDNYAYGFGLTDVTRSRLQRQIEKAKLLGSEEEDKRHARSKVVHAMLITMSVLVATNVRSMSTVADARWLANSMFGANAPFFAMMFGKWFEVMSGNSPNLEKLKSVAAAAFVCLVGGVASIVSWIVAARS